MTFDGFKSKITFDNKTLFGLALILVCIVLYRFNMLYSDFVRAMIIALPGIFLIVPKDTIKFNKILAIICAILLVICLASAFYSLYDTLTNYIFGSHYYSSYYSSYYSYSYYTPSYSNGYWFLAEDICLIVLSFYGLFCSFLLSIDTDGIENRNPALGNVAALQQAPAQQNTAKFCKECGTEVQGNAPFCPECGKKL